MARVDVSKIKEGRGGRPDTLFNRAGLGPNDAILNLFGREIEVPIGLLTTLELSDTWRALDGGAQWTVAQVTAIVNYMQDLMGTTNLRAVCNAGRNRSRFAACLYCIMFGLPPPDIGRPVTNVDYNEMLDAAQTARDNGESAHEIGRAVIDAAEGMLSPP